MADACATCKSRREDDRGCCAFESECDAAHDAAYFNRLADTGKFLGRDWMEAEEVMRETRQMGTSERRARASARRWGRWTRRSMGYSFGSINDKVDAMALEHVFTDACYAFHYAALALRLADEREALHRAARRVDRRWRKGFGLRVQQR